EIREVLDLVLLVVVREQDGVALALEAPDLLLEVEARVDGGLRWFVHRFLGGRVGSLSGISRAIDSTAARRRRAASAEGAAAAPNRTRTSTSPKPGRVSWRSGTSASVSPSRLPTSRAMASARHEITPETTAGTTRRSGRIRQAAVS